MRAARALTAAIGTAVVAMALASGASPAATPCRPGPAASCAGADLDGARLQKRNLTGATFTRASLVGARLQGAKLLSANLSRANLTRANLTGADLRGADLSRARLRGATLRGARLGRRGATGGRSARIAGIPCLKLCRGDLRGADFDGADLAGALFLSADLRGTRLGAATLTGASFVKVDLRGVTLAGAGLAGAYFQNSDLRGVSFAGADLSDAMFASGMDLRGTDFSGADLRGADLSRVAISPSALVGAKLEGAKLPASSVVRTKVTASRSFSATIDTGGITTTCTDATECEGVGAPNAASTLTVTTSWAGFAFCPDGPVRLSSTDGGTTYTGACSYTATQSMTIRLRENRRITVRVKDLVGDPATIAHIAFEWRAPPTYELVEAVHPCLGVSACIGEYADGSTVRVLITGSGPYLVPSTASCTGGTPVGENTMVSGPPWELTCLVDGDGHPLQLTADRELVVTLS